MKWLVRASLVRGNATATLGTLMDDVARLHGDRPLVTESGGYTLTAKEAAGRVARVAAGIASRVTPGDRVVFATENGYDTFVLCLGAARAGAIAVPVNARMTQAEIDHVISDSGAALVVHSADELSLGDPIAALPVDPAAVAAIFYTSGTTGRPKGAELTHRSLLASARTALAWPSELRHDEAVVGLPVAHIMGFTVLLGLAAAGVAVYFLPHFRPDVALDAIESRRASVFVGVPAMYRLLLEAGAEDRNLKSVRVWASGADVMPEGLARRFQRMGATATLPGIGSVGEAAFVEGYGMVEVGGGVAAKVAPPFLRLPAHDLLGIPTPPNRFRVVGDDGKPARVGTVGELQVKGPGVLKGYYRDPDATRAVLTDDGWLRTGDLARQGPLGMVFFAGRSKDVIKVGGFSVYAVEVELALQEHPAVAEAAVIGLPDERVGERVAAAVRLQPGAGASEDDILTFARSRLADYKVPSEIRFVHDLPRTGTEKVKKPELRSLFED